MLKDVVLGQRGERDELLGKKYIPREGLEGAQKQLHDPLIKVIVGPRRAGKSVFAVELLGKNDFAYLNFDDDRLMENFTSDSLLKSLKEVYGNITYFLFDEIQNLPGWELLVNRLHRRGNTLVLTGSNSRLLSRELATHLTGRYVQFQILPFSFPEYLQARGFSLEMAEEKEQQGVLLHHLDSYLSAGGYPEVVLKGVEPASYLNTLFESVLFKDVVKRYNVRYPKKLYDLGRYLITNHSSEFSLSRLRDMVSFRSVHTVENYLDYLEEAYVLFTVERYSTKIREQIRSPRKTYGYDTGLVNAVKFRQSPDVGRLMENVVAVELLRAGKEFYSYKTRDRKEVDFAIRERLKISRLYQICYRTEDGQTRKRETSGLLKAAQETRCKDLRIVTWDQERVEIVDAFKIQYVPLWKLLINRKRL